MFDKQRSFEDGVTRCRAFLSLNNVCEPTFIDASNGRDFGWYTSHKVHVDVKRTRPATITPGFAWSYPGYKADLTAYGVTAHEVGHHVQAITCVRGLKTDMFKMEIGRVVYHERPVSSYEPTLNESFAEMMKVFITNPDLLRVGRPIRWDFLTSHLSLKPVDDRPWVDVLKEAHPKIIAAAQRWARVK